MNKLILYIVAFLIGVILYKILNRKERFINISNDLKLITEDICKSPVAESYIIGGWCQCSYDHRPTWDNQIANTIIAGGFQPNGAWGPCHGNNICNQNDIEALNGYDNKWLSVGGDNVGTNQPASSCLDNAIDLINTFDMNGIAFDMEGCLHGNFEDVKSWINQNKSTLRSINPNFKFIYVPQGDNWLDPFNYNDEPDLFSYVAPMFYGGVTSYQETYDLQKIKDMINVWTCSDICGTGYAVGATGHSVPKEKLLLTFQSESANSDDTGKDILRELSNLVKNKGYAGILGWSNPDDTTNDNNNLRLINKIIKFDI